MKQEEYTDKILQGNCLEVLRTLPDGVVDCVVTSPPYWGLRDYGLEGSVWGGDIKCEHKWDEHIKKPTGGKGSKAAKVGANQNDFANMRDHDVVSNFCSKCGAWKGQLGLEPDYNDYISHLCDIFDEVKRVLKPEGTCWVNLGDSYANTGYGEGTGHFQHKNKEGAMKPKARCELPPKCLCDIPFRFSIEMINRGWTKRNTIIWHKPNCMPSSVADRFTVDFEYIFFFTKNKKYFFEQQFEKSIDPESYSGRRKRNAGLMAQHDKKNYAMAGSIQEDGTMKCGQVYPERNKRAVWLITTKAYREAHFATFPEELPIGCIKAGCPEQICNKCGKPRERIIEEGEILEERIPEVGLRTINKETLGQAGLRDGYVKRQKLDKGRTDCGCKAGFHGGLVLDPFMGSGTVAEVSRKLSMKYLGIECNPEYVKLIEKRLRQGYLF